MQMVLCSSSSFTVGDWWKWVRKIKYSNDRNKSSFKCVENQLENKALAKIAFCVPHPLIWCQIGLKGYLHYKTISSQNLSYEAQAKNFFISEKSYVPFSKYSSFCIFSHPMIYQICDVMISITTWDRVHFWTATQRRMS